MNKLYSFILILLSAGSIAQTQKFVFDRPGIADGPYVVSKSFPQIEGGFSYNTASDIQSSLNPGIMLRWGLFQKDELRLCYNYIPQSLFVMEKYALTGSINTALGWKHSLLKENHLIPETSVILNTFLPMKSSQIKIINYMGYELGFQFLNNFNENISLNYNVNTILNPGNDLFLGNYSICLNFNPLEKLGLFAENFSYIDIIHAYKAEWGFDAGIIFTPTNNSQIDFSAVLNRYGNENDLTYLIGYSYAFELKKDKN